MEHHDNPSHHHTGIHHDAVIKVLRDCALACETCAMACLEEADVTSFAHAIELTRDCAALCELGARLLIRDSEIARSLMLVCAEACKLAAAACGAHYNAHCQICATHCRDCEQLCGALQEDSL